ncbi:Protein argonaute-3 [Halotydeus destructor]|nr:Protein argonaute-3 [Halotydeus destructor]
MSRPAWGKAGGSQTSGSQTGASQAGRSQEAGPSGGGLRKPKPERGQRQVDEVAEQLAGVRIERPSTSQAAGTEIIRKKFDKYAKRPGYGTAGRKIKLLSNFFKITFGKNVSLSAYHYDLTISKVHAGAEGVEEDTTEREIVSKTLKRKLFLQWTSENSSIASKRPAFDGEKNFFTLVAVTPEAGRSTMVLKEEGSRDSTFVLKYKYVNHYVNITDCAPLSEDALQALDIILGYGSASQMIPIKSSVYFKSGEGPPRMKFAATRDNQGDLGTNFEMAFGWYKSARYVENGLMINLDRAVTVFQQGGFLLEIIERIYGKGSASKFENNEYWVPTLLEEIKGLKIRVVFPPQCRVPYSRTYLIDGLGRTPQEEKFEC